MPEVDQITLDRHIEVMRSLGVPGGVVEQNLRYMTVVDKLWQPADFLPDFRDRDKGKDDHQALMDEAAGLSKALLVVAVGNWITEEGISSYQKALERVKGAEDSTGVDDAPWPTFTRAWAAEEKRHDTVLSTWGELSGVVNTRAVQVSVTHEIRNGFDTLGGNDPYRHIVYTSIQEDATRLSHLNTGLLAGKQGAALFERICRAIASDESRHASFYRNILAAILDADPDGAMIAVKDMANERIAMPASRLNDGLFEPYSKLAKLSGVYTRRDYLAILLRLMEFWKIPEQRVYSEEGKAAQEELVRKMRIYSKVMDRDEKPPAVEDNDPVYRWVHAE